MLFENMKTFTKQGDLGEARAIYELTKKGYTISTPLTDSDKYDLIIDDGTTLSKVQVKTSGCKVRGGYQVNLVTAGSTPISYKRRVREDNDYDILFVLSEDDRCWLIPTENIDAKTALVVGTKKYKDYEIGIEK